MADQRVPSWEGDECTDRKNSLMPIDDPVLLSATEQRVVQLQLKYLENKTF